MSMTIGKLQGRILYMREMNEKNIKYIGEIDFLERKVEKKVMK